MIYSTQIRGENFLINFDGTGIKSESFYTSFTFKHSKVSELSELEEVIVNIARTHPSISKYKIENSADNPPLIYVEEIWQEPYSLKFLFKRREFNSLVFFEEES